MVLWEITVATAYFLGLKRTYRLALKLQRRLISPRHPRLRGFLHRRTRYAFEVALSVHRKVQERDIEVGRNLGNAILRWLDRAKPSAEIRPPTGHFSPRATAPVKTKPPPSSASTLPRRRLFHSPPFRPFIGGVSGSSCSQRRLSSPHPSLGFRGVFREDILQWMRMEPQRNHSVLAFQNNSLVSLKRPFILERASLSSLSCT